MIKKFTVGLILAILTVVTMFCVDFKINHRRANQLIKYFQKIVHSVAKPKKYKKATKSDKLIAPTWATVLRVSDGDTVQVAINDKKYSIRLFGIDAPEKFQKFGAESTQHLKQLINNNRIYLKPVSSDRYGRIVSKIYAAQKSGNLKKAVYLNLKQVEAGLAWHYKKYAKKEKDLEFAQLKAKKNRVGLWSQEKPINPEIFRRKLKY